MTFDKVLWYYFCVPMVMSFLLRFSAHSVPVQSTFTADDVMIPDGLVQTWHLLSLRGRHAQDSFKRLLPFGSPVCPNAVLHPAALSECFKVSHVLMLTVLIPNGRFSFICHTGGNLRPLLGYKERPWC